MQCGFVEQKEQKGTGHALLMCRDALVSQGGLVVVTNGDGPLLSRATLQQLVDGVKATGSVDKKIKYLRRIPKDPMTNSYDWGMRSTRDDPKAQAWGGQNVFDVYTKSMFKARDGTSYSEW